MTLINLSEFLQALLFSLPLLVGVTVWLVRLEGKQSVQDQKLNGIKDIQDQRIADLKELILNQFALSNAETGRRLERIERSLNGHLKD